MAEIVYTYQRYLKEFGRQPEFQDLEPEVLCDIYPKKELRDMYVIQNPIETEILNAPDLSENTTNTERVILKSHGMVHLEGGWPPGVDPTEVESKLKYTKKAERDDAYGEAVRRLVAPVEALLKQNNAIDIYEEYFPAAPPKSSTGATAGAAAGASAGSAAGGAASGGSGSGGGVVGSTVEADLRFASPFESCTPPSAKTRAVVADPSGMRRTAARVSWQGDRRLAVAYCNTRWQAVAATASGGSASQAGVKAHVFDVTNPTAPEHDLLASAPVTALEFNPKDVHLLAGGAYNGVVHIWDSRHPPNAVAKSKVEHSHRDAVTDLRWLMSKSGEVLTTSPDGQVLIWDIKKMDAPIESETVVLQARPQDVGPKGILGGMSIDYDPLVGGPSKYMVGTEQGSILNCNRRGKSPADRIMGSYFGHHGPVLSVMRNPHFPKFFLTVGDWTARLWTDDLRAPVISTPYASAYVTSGIWHPVRPAVFLTTRPDGVLEAWDLLFKHSAPVVSAAVSDAPLSTIRAQADGRLVAVGATDGTVALVELSAGLAELQRDEKVNFGAALEREAARDKALIQRAKEIRQRGQRRPSVGARDQRDQPGVDEAALGELAEQYLRQVKQEEETQLRVERERKDRRDKALADMAAESIPAIVAPQDQTPAPAS